MLHELVIQRSALLANLARKGFPTELPASAPPPDVAPSVRSTGPSSCVGETASSSSAAPSAALG
eukprot:4517896-Prymnesium_polylepis.1